MEKMDNYIDDLFRQKLSGAKASVTPSGAEWMQLSKTIRWEKFIHFSPASFNVYYLAAALGGVATTSAFVLPDVISGQHEKGLHKQATIVSDTISKQEIISSANDSTFEASTEMFAPAKENAKIKSRCVDEIPLVNCVEPASSPISEPVTAVQDSTIREEEGKIEPTDQTPQIEPVRADTIIRVDTVRIQKKGVQFKRKKPTF